MKTQLIAMLFLATLAAGATSTQDLVDTEVQGLRYMRQEEKLARDVYQKLELKWGARPFGNIVLGEETHMEGVLTTMKRYGLSDPVKDAAGGTFPDQAFVDLYRKLVAKGLGSRVAALQVGCEIEELDIKDLRERSNATTHADIRQLYANLEQGSVNHLRAFHRVLLRSGGEYKPTHLDQGAFDKIVGR